MASVPALDELARTELVPVAFDAMLSGMIVTRAMLPQVVMAGGDLDLMNVIAIEEWMGASPVYTARMKRLMGIEGTDVNTIIKALQLDVGFVHQYMDVVYEVTDEHHAEFWLNHCGALLDAEPHGEERVFGMCHTIEDPTFDATALATNPRARIRPIHRPPRTPSDRHPHCHWTLIIDETNEPVGPVPLTEQVASLPLAGVPNDMPSDREPGGMRDYRGPLNTGFHLADLSSGALVGAAREFQMQSHLLVAATELSLASHFDADTARSIIADAWVGAGWIGSERLAHALKLDDRGGEGPGVEGMARVLALTPMLPPGFDRTITVDGERVHVELTPVVAGVLDAKHPGWCGVLARGDARGLEGIVHGVDRRAALSGLTVGDDRVSFDVVLDADATPVAEPDPVALVRIGMVSSWTFDVSDPVVPSRS